MTIMNGSPGCPGDTLHGLTADAAAATGTGSWAAVPIGVRVPSGFDGEGNRDG
jgi:hypothetical protein